MIIIFFLSLVIYLVVVIKGGLSLNARASRKYGWQVDSVASVWRIFGWMFFWFIVLPVQIIVSMST